MKEAIVSTLYELFPREQIKLNEPMKNHTSFKTGGNADVFIIPRNVAELRVAVRFCNNESLPYYVIGNGSNLLVRDKGFRGVIISTEALKGCKVINETEVEIEAGCLLAYAAKIALKHNLSGFEFASGIPGTFGGAVCMNAGAYDGEIKNVFVSGEVLMPNGSIAKLSADEMGFGYRTSNVQKNGWIVLSGVIGLLPGNYPDINAKMLELNKRRHDKQPLEKPSAGSTFKRPEGYFAGKLIMDSSLRGFSIGGAQVSEKHCGFVINNNGATSDDIIKLIEHVKKVVFDKQGVVLEPEVKIIGEE